MYFHSQFYFKYDSTFIFQVIKTIPKPDDYSKENPQTTVGFCSDGTYFYWIWFAGAASDKSSKGVPVYLEKFTFDVSTRYEYLSNFFFLMKFGLINKEKINYNH